MVANELEHLLASDVDDTRKLWLASQHCSQAEYVMQGSLEAHSFVVEMRPTWAVRMLINIYSQSNPVSPVLQRLNLRKCC